MDSKQFEAMLSDAETRLRRLKTLYDQWFAGIERTEPAVARKELEDLLIRLRREQVNNTALRFRMQQIVQRHTSFSTYWRRIARQIEEGTFKRDLVRARKGKKRRKGAEVEEGDFELSYEIDVDLDIDLAYADAHAEPEVPERSPAPPAAPPLVADSAAEREVAAATVAPATKARGSKRASKPSPEAAGAMASAASAPSHAPSAGAKRTKPPKAPALGSLAPPLGSQAPPLGSLAPPLGSLAPPLGSLAPGELALGSQAPAPGSKAPLLGSKAPPPPPRTALKAPPLTGLKAPPLGGLKAPLPPGSHLAAPVAAGAVPTGAERAQLVATGAGHSGTGQVRIVPATEPAAAKIAAAVRASPSQAQVGAVATSKRHAVSAAPKPQPVQVDAQVAANGNAAALSSDDVERIYAKYVAARKQNAERTDNVKLGNIEKTLRGMLPQLEKKHAGKKIDFEVVVKDGKVALKPVAK